MESEKKRFLFIFLQFLCIFFISLSMTLFWIISGDKEAYIK